MKIALINANTSSALTDLALNSAQKIVHNSHTEIIGITPTEGPISIECAYDEAMAIPGILRAIRTYDDCDAYIIACFDDPGITAAREITCAPVIGIAEAAMHMASFLGNFSIVTTLSRTLPRARELAYQYGFTHKISGYRACEIPVLELETDPAAYSAIKHECMEAILQDQCDAIVLGCIGMSGISQQLSEECDIPVIDGVAAASLLAESLVKLGLFTRNSGIYALPPRKEYTGILSPWSFPAS